MTILEHILYIYVVFFPQFQFVSVWYENPTPGAWSLFGVDNL